MAVRIPLRERLVAAADRRRLEAAVARTLARLDGLGPHWHVVSSGRSGFLVIGPGGVYAITVVAHGRSRVLLAGDLVLINRDRPDHVAESRRAARRAAEALSAAAGLTVPVAAVLAFVGSGPLSLHGLPKEVLVATDEDLDRLVVAGGVRLPPAAVSTLAAAAERATGER